MLHVLFYSSRRQVFHLTTQFFFRDDLGKTCIEYFAYVISLARKHALTSSVGYCAKQLANASHNGTLPLQYKVKGMGITLYTRYFCIYTLPLTFTRIINLTLTLTLALTAKFSL